MSEPTDQSLTTLADAAFRQAAAKVVLRAQQTGTPLIVWDGERVQTIPPEQAKVTGADAPSTSAPLSPP